MYGRIFQTVFVLTLNFCRIFVALRKVAREETNVNPSFTFMQHSIRIAQLNGWRQVIIFFIEYIKFVTFAKSH